MKPSKYSVLIIPDSGDNKRQFTISRKFFLAVTIGTILCLSLIAIMAIYAFPRLMTYRTMEEQNAKYSSERVKIMELMQGLNRIEQMDKHIRKTLGAELQLPSDSLNQNNNSGTDFAVSYIKNIPSLYPVEGYITQKMIKYDSDDGQNHLGIDIAVKEGEAIHAAASGFVVFSGWTNDFGNYIILYHGDDYFSVYGHNKINFVKNRELINRGDVIATTGATGNASGPHLHLEIWKDGVAINPMELFPKYKLRDMSVTKYE